MNKNLYEKYHSSRKISKKIISSNNFTYINLLKVIDKCIRSKNLEILDVGCGVGTLSLYLASKGNNVLGIDISKNAIDIAIKNSIAVGLDNRTKFICDNFMNHKFNKKFDVIVVSEVLEHVSDDNLVLRTVKNLSTQDSIIILSVPSENAPLYKMGFLKDFDKKVGHVRRYTLDKLLKVTSDEGYVPIVKIEAEGLLRNLLFTNNVFGFFIRFLKGPFSSMFQFIDKILVSLFGESQIIIICKLK